ncbi:MAG: hypothetical protein JO297_07130 [Nitrososphaeraceae archaeon]|nr:hypothetical protein [Nitrososphaeraceae archaeon]
MSISSKRQAWDVGASITFEPGFCTAWHTHRLDQILIMTAGCGLVQWWDGQVEEIRPGEWKFERINDGIKHGRWQ